MIPENVSLFQKDLKAGMSIEDALIKHNLTLKDALSELQGKNYSKPRKKKKRKYNSHPTGEIYVHIAIGKYTVKKTINKKLIYFGRYNTLKDAVTVRDYLIENGWTRTNANRIRKEIGYDRL